MSPKIVEKLFTFRDAFLSIWALNHHVSRQRAFRIVIPCPAPTNKEKKWAHHCCYLISALLPEITYFTQATAGHEDIRHLTNMGWGIHSLPSFHSSLLAGIDGNSYPESGDRQHWSLMIWIIRAWFSKSQPVHPIKTIPHSQTFSGNCA